MLFGHPQAFFEATLCRGHVVERAMDVAQVVQAQGQASVVGAAPMDGDGLFVQCGGTRLIAARLGEDGAGVGVGCNFTFGTGGTRTAQPLLCAVLGLGVAPQVFQRQGQGVEHGALAGIVTYRLGCGQGVARQGLGRVQLATSKVQDGGGLQQSRTCRRIGGSARSRCDRGQSRGDQRRQLAHPSSGRSELGPGARGAGDSARIAARNQRCPGTAEVLEVGADLIEHRRIGPDACNSARLQTTRVVFGVRASGVDAVRRMLGQLLGSELTDQRVQIEAAVADHLHQGPVDQPGQRHAATACHRQRGAACEAAAKDAQARQCDLLATQQRAGPEQAPRQRQRGAHAVVARLAGGAAGSQRIDRLLQIGQDGGGAMLRDRTRGQFERQGPAAGRTHELEARRPVRGDVEVGKQGPCAQVQQAHGIESHGLLGIGRRVVGFGAAHAFQRVAALGRHGQRRPRGHQPGRARRCALQLCQQRRQVGEVLGVVQNDQALARGQRGAHLKPNVALRHERQADLRGQARQRAGSVAQVGQGDPGHAVAPAPGQTLGQLACDAALAHAARSGEGDDVAALGAEHRLQLAELHLATDKHIARRHCMFRRCHRGRCRADQSRGQGGQGQRRFHAQGLSQSITKLLEQAACIAGAPEFGEVMQLVRERFVIQRVGGHQDGAQRHGLACGQAASRELRQRCLAPLTLQRGAFELGPFLECREARKTHAGQQWLCVPDELVDEFAVAGIADRHRAATGGGECMPQFGHVGGQRQTHALALDLEGAVDALTQQQGTRPVQVDAQVVLRFAGRCIGPEQGTQVLARNPIAFHGQKADGPARQRMRQVPAALGGTPVGRSEQMQHDRGCGKSLTQPIVGPHFALRSLSAATALTFG